MGRGRGGASPVASPDAYCPPLRGASRVLGGCRRDQPGGSTKRRLDVAQPRPGTAARSRPGAARRVAAGPSVTPTESLPSTSTPPLPCGQRSSRGRRPRSSAASPAPPSRDLSPVADRFGSCPAPDPAPGGVPENSPADARRKLDTLCNRCELWELTPAVCDLASILARPPNPCARWTLCISRRFLWRGRASKGTSCSPPTSASKTPQARSEECAGVNSHRSRGRGHRRIFTSGRGAGSYKALPFVPSSRVGLR
jgi:hypothetical protein